MSSDFRQSIKEAVEKEFEVNDEVIMEFFTIGIKANGNISCEVDDLVAQYVEFESILDEKDSADLIRITTKINNALYSAIHKEDIE